MTVNYFFIFKLYISVGRLYMIKPLKKRYFRGFTSVSLNLPGSVFTIARIKYRVFLKYIFYLAISV